MKKTIFFIVLIISNIFMISCNNRQTEQPVSNNINSQNNINAPTEQLTPTPITKNIENKDKTVLNDEPPTTSIAATNDSNLNNTKSNNDIVTEDSINKSVDYNLCSVNEEVLFSFKIANSNKSASICISKNQQDYIVYRYGTEDKIELEYPIKTDDSWSLFTYSYYLRGGGPDNDGLDLNYLSFKNGGYTYELYEEYNSESDIPLIGIKVTNQETNEETDIPGDSNSINGTLISLRDNTKIEISAE